MTNPIINALQFRHACKVFDENKKIPSHELTMILESGRISPSSFGMEPWKFLVIQNEELKAKIRPACWDQVQITSCSDLVIILASIEDVKPESGYPLKMFSRREIPQEQKDAYINIYSQHLADTLSSDKNILAWTARQCYIAASNMMTTAASLGIDSCPIEGFDKEAVEKILELDTSKHQLAVVLPFGYRLNEQSTQLRRSFDDVVSYL
jgi:nitroreductase